MDNKQNEAENNAGQDFQINLQPEEILQKEFKTKMRGYDPTEVDGFLDSIIKDYEAYIHEVNRLQSENNRLNARVDELNNELNQAQSNQGAPVQSQTSSTTNYDILKRLSNLEQHVFGSKLNENNQAQNGYNMQTSQNYNPGYSNQNNPQSNPNGNYNSGQLNRF